MEHRQLNVCSAGKLCPQWTLRTPVSTATYPSVTKARAFYSPSHGFRTGLL